MNYFNKGSYVIEGKFIADQLMILQQIFLCWL